jgi:glucose-1-phosphate cytidylyltransferase
MKVIILAGGLGTRLTEETESKPKPMVLIDDKPILWHLMNIFAQQGLDEFVLALGYKGEVIKRWLGGNDNLSWNVKALETGLNTQTGGRIAQCMRSLPGERVIATYGDGLANVSIRELLKFHESHGKLATVTAVRPPARFGYLETEDGRVTHFGEKNQADAGWINGGFFVLEPQVADLIHDDADAFELTALPKLAEMGELMAYEHKGFWQPMDTLREKQDLAKYALQLPPPWLQGLNESKLQSTKGVRW